MKAMEATTTTSETQPSSREEAWFATGPALVLYIAGAKLGNRRWRSVCFLRSPAPGSCGSRVNSRARWVEDALPRQWLRWPSPWCPSI